jgi:hypothetical protein
MTDLELIMERDLAQSACAAWRDVFLSIEAHLKDRIAMGDPAKPLTYLAIIQAEVANVNRSSKSIVNARWADSARYQKRIAELEAANPLTGCLHPGNEPNSCQYEGKCQSVACNHYGKTEYRPRMTVLAQVDGISYPEER